MMSCNVRNARRDAVERAAQAADSKRAEVDRMVRARVKARGPHGLAAALSADLSRVQPHAFHGRERP